MTYKVLGFDNWTQASHYYERLAKTFAEQGLDFSMLHLGSWGNDPGRPDEEIIGSLRWRDISYYKGMGYSQILEAEKPDLVLFMSTDTFAHRSFNRYCRKMGVPTIHVYHGVISVQPVHLSKKWKINIFAQVLYALSKIPKALRYVWPNYARSLWDTGASFAEWKRFVSDVVIGAMGRFSVVSAADARTDRCCVLVDADIEHAINKYGFARDEVSAVGLPDLMSFGLKPQQMGSLLDRDVSGATDVMYIDGALVYTGGSFASPQAFVEHMVKTGEALAAQERRMLFKPHPAHYSSGVVDEAVKRGITVCDRQDFIPALANCAAAMVEISSAAIIPALMGLPLLLVKYGALSEQVYGELLTSYPRTRVLSDPAQTNGLLESEQKVLQPGAARDWIVRNAGPLPAEDLPLRVARVIIDLIATFRKKSATAHAG